MFRKKRSSRSSYIAGSILGGFIAVASYYLLATTEKGKDFKAELASRVPEKKASSGSLSHLLLEFGGEWSEDLKEVLNESKNRNHQGTAKQSKNQVISQEQSEIGELIQGVLDEE
ncbi:hypothetical protein [Bacillus sp. FJAT-45037]|uniref:hypothetical protein n=1 Tax=Bacillus sp. FJAT-45037 TaxID=2011007 RepID=UPI000C2405B9|nr:hypothetical protein [Bacillus sp. FJAT-45037]